MKKLFAIILALTVIMSLSITAFAANEPTVTAGSKLEITKNLTVKGYEDEASENATKYPSHTLSFTTPVGSVEEGGVGSVDENGKVPALTVTPGTITEGADTATVEITVPDFKAVGIYTYTFKEVDPQVAGVTVNPNDITVVFTVINDTTTGKLIVAAIHCESPIQTVFLDDQGNKVDEEGKPIAADDVKKTSEFENVYEAGALKVTKVVTGNMGDKSKKFSIKVTFNSTKAVNGTIVYSGAVEGTIAPSAWTNGSASVTVQLANSESVEFDNIPEDVTYTVAEVEGENETAIAANGETKDGHTVTYTNAEGTIAAEELSDATVTNKKEGNIDTGIILDSMPYVLLLAAGIAIAVVMVIRKRRTVED